MNKITFRKTTLIAMCFAGLAVTTAPAAVMIDYVPVGNAGNPNDSTGYGGVSYDYNIGRRMEAMRDDLHGDVTKLKAQGHRDRLRVGSHRVLFVLAGDAIQVYAVKERKEAYE